MTNIKDILNSLLALEKLALESTYYQQPIPCELDDGIRDILADLYGHDQKDIELISTSVSNDNGRVLGLFAERMASLAVRQNSIEPVKSGLFALLIYIKTEDPRDVLLVLSLLHDAVIKVGDIPKTIFNEVGTLFGGISFLSDFLNRSDEDKSIDAMGYEESKNEEGFLYVRAW